MPLTRRRAYRILEKAESGDRLSAAVDAFLVSLVLANVVAAVLETVPTIAAAAPGFFHWFERVSITVFAVEYLLRIWSCRANPKYENGLAGHLRFALTPLMVLDLAVLVLPYWFDLRPLRILRLVRLSRYSRRLQILGEVVRDKRDELAVSIAVALGLLVATSTAMYYVEHDDNPDFTSIPSTMWWGVATLTTVGYGDVTPITPGGRVLGALVALIGIGMFALPAGILAGGFGEALEREKKRRTALHQCPHCGEPLG